MAEKHHNEKEIDNILSEINSNIKTEKPDGFSKHNISKKLEGQLQFSKNANIIESAMADDYNDDHKLIEIADAEKVETEEEPPREEPVQRTSKISKAELKKTSGTVLAKTENSNITQKKKITKKQTLAAILGVIFTFFIIVGVISTVAKVIEISSNIVNSTSVKQELTRVIYPLVIIDTPEFEDPSKLDSSAIISSSIWSFIISEDDKSKYRTDDLGATYVPDVDIETYVRKLFGSEVEIKHQSIDDSNVSMAYSPESKTYVIESTPRFLPYTPRIDKVSKSGDIYTLRVSYILPSVLWNIEANSSALVVDKVMEYKLKRVENHQYQVLSVSLLEIAQVDTTDQTPVTSYDPNEMIDEEFPEIPLTDGSSDEPSSEDTSSDSETDSGDTSSDSETDSGDTSSDGGAESSEDASE